MASLGNRWLALAKIKENWKAHIGFLERFLQPLFVLFLDFLDLGSEDLFLALFHWSALIKR